MGLETGSVISDLVITNPTAGDPVSQGDDHLRLLKTVIKATPIVIDRAYGEYTTNANLTTVIPLDDTIPQNTEGTQIISVALTPKATTSRVRLRFQGVFSIGQAANGTVAIFSSASANALTASTQSVTTTDLNFPLICEHEYVPGTTSALTFTVRVGPTAGTMRMNGSPNFGRYFGGVAKATLVVEEIQA
jgi:hypothetical protein